MIDRLRTPESWRPRSRLAAGAASGLLTLVAFPPLDQGWAGFVALVPLALGLRGASGRVGLLVGLAWGIPFFGILLGWISFFGFLAWGLLVVAQSGFVAVFGVFAARIARRGPWARAAALPVLWAALEMARARWPLGGFAWGVMGYSQHDGPALPAARIGGVFLLSVVLVAVNVLAAEVFTARSWDRRASAAIGGAVLAFGPAALPLGLAGARAASIDVAAVQGNVPRDRFAGFARRGRLGPEDFAVVDNHVRESEALVGNAPDLVVWPENALDRDPILNPEFFEPVGDVVRRIGAPLIAGAILDAGERFRNTNLLIDPSGNIVDRYDKQHLVPFGEYVPWAWARDVVPALDRELPTDGEPGDAPVVFRADGVRVGTVICFESTYPSLVRDVVRQGAELIVVTTNNASFRTSPAAAQHLAMSRMRAVEHGRAVVHAAIAGISAIVMPDGTIAGRAGLFRPAVLRAEVPLTRGETPYTRLGAAIEGGIAAGAVIAAAVALVRARRRPQEGEP